MLAKILKLAYVLLYFFWILPMMVEAIVVYAFMGDSLGITSVILGSAIPTSILWYITRNTPSHPV